MAKFSKGKSGNPNGRPKTESAALRKALADRGGEVADVVLAAALGGDLAACRMVLERLVAPLKATEPPVTLSLPAGEGITAQGRAIVSAVAAGTLAPGQGAQLLSGLGALARIKEIDELEKRITALEAKQNGNT